MKETAKLTREHYYNFIICKYKRHSLQIPVFLKFFRSPWRRSWDFIL